MEIESKQSLQQSLQEGRDALAREHEELQRLFKLVRVAKQEWEMAMDCVDDMVVLTDKQGAIRRCNKAFKAFTGKKYDEILGRDCVELLVDHGIEIDTLHCGELEVFHRPGKLWYRISTSLVLGEDADQVAGTVVTLHDSTDIRLMTQKLEQANRQTEEGRLELQRALDELSLLIQRVGHEQTFGVRYQNPNLAKCHKVKNCTKTDCPCHGKEAMRCWQIAGTFCGNKAQGEFAQKYANCIECEVFKTAAPTPIFQIGEHFNNMMHILETKNKELEDAYSELKLTQSKILQQEKMASIGQLAAGVAHEINNPMGFISSNLGTLNKYLDRVYEYMGLLAETAGQAQAPEVSARLEDARRRLKVDFIIDDTQKLIAESLEGADRVKTIVQNLKSFSRVDQAEAKLFDVNECIETTLNIVWNELKYKATVKKEYGALPVTMCYPQQLNQVFMNLLVNAGQAIEDQGEITIRTRHQDGTIFASVSDTGAGISPDKLALIFEPFFTTKEVGKGTGLGLSITYDIVKKHDGEITVESEVGKGTTFTVRLPVREKI